MTITPLRIALTLSVALIISGHAQSNGDTLVWNSTAAITSWNSNSANANWYDLNSSSNVKLSTVGAQGRSYHFLFAGTGTNSTGLPTSTTFSASFNALSLTFANNFNGTNTTTFGNGGSTAQTFTLGNNGSGTATPWTFTNQATSGSVTFNSNNGGSGGTTLQLYSSGTISVAAGGTTNLGLVIRNYDSTHTGGITKIGAGTLTLSGANTYSGGTIISQGRLTASHTQAFGTGDVHVGANGTLNLNNVALSNRLLLDSGSVLSTSGANAGYGGTFSGSSTVNGPLSLTSSAIYAWALGDALTVTSGALAIDANFSLSLNALTTGSFATNINHSWLIFDTAGSGTINGSTFNLINTSSAFDHLGAFSYAITDHAVTLNWSAATAAIPEPSTYAMIFGLIGMAAVATQRRRALKSKAHLARHLVR